MAATITTSTVAKALVPGAIKDWFGVGYDEYPTIYTQYMDMETSDREFEEFVQLTGFGLVPQKPQGAPMATDTIRQGYINRFTHIGYGLGFIITHEAIADNKYAQVAEARTIALGTAFRQTKETVCANLLNRAFNSSFTFGDGVELISNAHPTISGNQSNEFTSADFSEAAIEDISIGVRRFRDDRRNVLRANIDIWILPPELEFDAMRVLDSEMQSGTANNDINAYKKSNNGKKFIINPFLEATDAYFAKTSIRNGYVLVEREDLPIAQDNTINSMNLSYYKYQRYSVGSVEWRGATGSTGTGA